MLRATGLTKSFGDVHALKGSDLEVNAGQVVALLGRNGAGKTTLLSILSGSVNNPPQRWPPSSASRRCSIGGPANSPAVRPDGCTQRALSFTLPAF